MGLSTVKTRSMKFFAPTLDHDPAFVSGSIWYGSQYLTTGSLKQNGTFPTAVNQVDGSIRFNSANAHWVATTCKFFNIAIPAYGEGIIKATVYGILPNSIFGFVSNPTAGNTYTGMVTDRIVFSTVTNTLQHHAASGSMQEIFRAALGDSTDDSAASSYLAAESAAVAGYDKASALIYELSLIVSLVGSVSTIRSTISMNGNLMAKTEFVRGPFAGDVREWLFCIGTKEATNLDIFDIEVQS